MKNWKKHFRDEILDRGLDYYSINAVGIYQIYNDFIEAKVMGTREYDVVIYFNDSQIESMSCDCPYFQGYGYCKHLAATLYYIEDHRELLIKKEDYSQLLQSISYGDLIEFLSLELPENPDLANRLKMFMNINVDDSFYINKLEISLNSSPEIIRFIDRDIHDLIRVNYFELIFRLCRMIIDHINNELEYGEFPLLADIIFKLDDLMCEISNTEASEGVSDFLEYAINSSDDYFILNELTDCMSRAGDMSRLLDGDEFP